MAADVSPTKEVVKKFTNSKKREPDKKGVKKSKLAEIFSKMHNK